MIQRRHQALATVYLVNDAVASNLALLAAWYLRFVLEVIPVTKGTQGVGVYASILPLVTVIFPLAFSLQGLYREYSSRSERWASVLIGTVLGTVVLSGVLLWLRPGDPTEFYSRATLAIFALCEFGFVVLGREIVGQIVQRRHEKGKDLDRVVIAGNGELARAVAARLASRHDLGLQVAGYLEHDAAEGQIEDLACLGRVEDAAALMERHGIAHVFVALPQQSSPAMMQLLDDLFRQCVSIHVVPDLLQFMVLRSRVEEIDGLPTINLSDTPLAGWSRVVKRLFDVCVASVSLLLTLPLLAAIAVAIWIEDRGPILYRQVRMGLDGKPFDILKFRSMKVHAEAETGAVWAEKDDPRRTKVGRFIRAWSLDELPQLWNVLRGEMSIIGPRPERPEFVEQFRAEFPHYMLRHKVRAGITGWAQVNGWRGNTSIRTRIEHDLYYIENWSLALDVKILFMTIKHGLRHENAY